MLQVSTRRVDTVNAVDPRRLNGPDFTGWVVPAPAA